MLTYRILVADDNPQIHQDFRSIIQRRGTDIQSELDQIFREVTAGMEYDHTYEKDPLTELEFQVDAAYQGEEAIEMVKESLTSGMRYAVAFVDVRMPPGIDGIQTIKRIWEVDPDIQIVICTAYSDHTWADIYKRLNPRDNLLILKKPFDVAEVMQMVFTLCDKWQVTAQFVATRDDLEHIIEFQEQQLLETFRLAQLGELVGSISHEVKSPVAAIKMRSDQIARDMQHLQGESKERVLQHTEAISSTCSRIVQIVDGLLDHVRDDHDQIKLSTIDLESVVDAALGLCAHRIQVVKVKVEKNIPKNLFCQGHAIQLGQVFTNLINNAVDAIAELTERWIRIDATQNDGKVLVSIADSGPRVSDEVAKKMMRPFFTTKSRGKGSGLGLSIARKILARHNGKMELDRQAPTTTFRLEIPLAIKN